MIFGWFRLFRSLLFTMPVVSHSESLIEMRRSNYHAPSRVNLMLARRPEQDDYG